MDRLPAPWAALAYGSGNRPASVSAGGLFAVLRPARGGCWWPGDIGQQGQERLLLVVEVGVQLRGHRVQLGAEALRVGDGDTGQQGHQLTLDARDGEVFVAQPVEGVGQVGVVAGDPREQMVVLAGVVELQGLAERQAALPDLQSETGRGWFAGPSVRRAISVAGAAPRRGVRPGGARRNGDRSPHPRRGSRHRA